MHGIRPTLTGFLSINTSIAKQGKQRVHQVPVPDSGDLNLFQRTSGTVMFLTEFRYHRFRKDVIRVSGKEPNSIATLRTTRHLSRS